MDTNVKKYAVERNKRIRPEGTAQYINLNDSELRKLVADPWVDYEALAREDQPLQDGGTTKFLVIGAGINGILYAARLIEAGFSPQDIVLVDTAGGYGGTWYWNRYPGLMCDVEGYCYLPLLEETSYMPKHKYSFGAEIRGQLERIATQYRFQAMFSTKVDQHIWDDTKGRWIVELTQSFGKVQPPKQMTVQTQFLFLCGGVLSIPKAPAVPGYAEFCARKEIFHTSRWNYTITGGSQEQPDLVNLRDKRVAIIGTGATSVQAVPHLARWAKHLCIIQRTPSYCGERCQQETTPETWAKVIASGEGWQRRRMTNLNSFMSADPEPEDLVNDGWSRNQARAGLIGSSSRLMDQAATKGHIDELLKMDEPIANELRARVESEVRDPAIAEKLKPWYPGWCKRPTFNDDYLTTFNRPNVTLVDTDGKGIDRYTESGIVVGGHQLEVDVLVLATGFTVASQLLPEDNVKATVIGREGRHLNEKWGSPDFGTVYGVATHGFPNLFARLGPGGPASYNMTSGYDMTGRFIAHIIAHATKESSHPERLVIEACKQKEEKWTTEVGKRAAWYSALSICTPSYFNGEGARVATTPEEAYQRGLKASWGSGANDYERIVDEYVKNTANQLQGFLMREV
ncbi:phenylacetone monooxygenase [Fusarium sporotrichioides]|uniref:Phenylacetone monooxygenase n=1 Tax=Fusarium sporotrichioides TaxID=5514 RepID=A0A395SHD0_FUSSP|nr:phenylacetone monooxygenase [Fusarium sporotrichioides]